MKVSDENLPSRLITPCLTSRLSTVACDVGLKQWSKCNAVTLYLPECIHGDLFVLF